MAIHAEAVETLVRKSHFDPEVALGIAQAIEASINLTQVVTVPVLDARLQELRHEVKSEFAEVRTEMAKMRGDMTIELEKMRAATATEFGNMRAEIATEFGNVRGEMATEFGNVRAEMATEFGKVRAEMGKGFGELLAQTKGDKADLMRWMLFTMLSSVLFGMVGKFIMKFFGY